MILCIYLYKVYLYYLLFVLFIDFLEDSWKLYFIMIDRCKKLVFEIGLFFYFLSKDNVLVFFREFVMIGIYSIKLVLFYVVI